MVSLLHLSVLFLHLGIPNDAPWIALVPCLLIGLKSEPLRNALPVWLSRTSVGLVSSGRSARFFLWEDAVGFSVHVFPVRRFAAAALTLPIYYVKHHQLLALFEKLSSRGNELDVGIAGAAFILEDTSTNDEPAETATARNWARGWAFTNTTSAAVVVQARSAPLSKGTYTVLDLPGHSNQGCKAYLLLHTPAPVRYAHCCSGISSSYRAASCAPIVLPPAASHTPRKPLRIRSSCWQCSHVLPAMMTSAAY